MGTSSIFGKLQKLGKSLMLPIAVMPVVALLLRFGALWNSKVLLAAGDAVFGNLAVLFAIGVAIGVAKDNNGTAGLAGAIGYYTTTAVAPVINEVIEVKKMGVLAGMVAGLIAGNLYNKYHDIKLPDFLGFFGGKRFVPIITSLVSILVGIAYGFIWPSVQGGIDGVGQWIVGAGAVGPFVFGTVNRLLIPTGLHHILNSIVWFVFGEFNGATGDLGRFFAGDPNAGVFMTGFFPVMMFGLPAAALAMYHTAKSESKKAVGGALVSVAFTAFLTGITEPIEFLFMFLAPGLYLIHAVLTGIALAVTNVMGIHHGFGFSAGAIDYVVNMGLATKGMMLIPIGLVFFAIYYFIFLFAIKKFDIKTLGREDDMEIKEDVNFEKNDLNQLAVEYIASLGGVDNIVELDSCITRLRLTLKDTQLIDEKKIKQLGSAGILKINSTNMQVIVGTKAEILCGKMKDMMK